MSNNKINEEGLLDLISIIYEDKDCLVINKPAGLLVHSDGRSKGPFVADWFLKHYPNTINVGDPMTDQLGRAINRAGVVHRLDKDTSGALILAKTIEAHANLKKQFQERSIIKKYLAFVWGDMKEHFGTINRKIGRSASDFRKYSASRGVRGDIRDAETYWTKKGSGEILIKDYSDKDEKKKIKAKFSVLEIEPKTGRTHQIRVHMNVINHPVLGDNLYAPKRPFVLDFKRLALHAYSIEFDKLSGERQKVISPLPDDFVGSLKILGIESLILV